MRKYILLMGIIAFLGVGYLLVDKMLFDGIKAQAIDGYGFQGNYFAKENTENKPAIILIGGGQWGDYWAQEFAKKDFVGLSLPYVGQEGLPRLPEELDLAYFEEAIKWLGKQQAAASDKSIVMGASRNAELALVIASTFPEIVGGAVAYAPSAVVWPNTVLAYNSDEMKASWTYKGADVPYIPMEKMAGNDSDKIETLSYWESGLSQARYLDTASIKVEQIKGPILLFSGMDDQVWPAAKMADMIEARLKKNHFAYDFKNIKYEQAGHAISGNPAYFSKERSRTMNIGRKVYKYELGGTNEGDFNARKDAYQQLFTFLTHVSHE